MLHRLLLAFALLVLSSGLSYAERPAPKLSERLILTAPPREAAALVFRDGGNKEVTLRDFRGKWVLLNLWATWCASCVKEMASLNALPPLLGERVVLVALAQDRGGMVAVPSFYRRHGLKNLKVFVDPDGSALTRLATRGLPTTLLINPAGEEVGRVQGDLDWTQADNLEFLRTMVGTPKR